MRIPTMNVPSTPLDAPASAPVEAIEHELEQYGGTEGDLSDRPRLVVLNKVDVPEARELAELVKPVLEDLGYGVHIVSAVSHEGLRELGFALADMVKSARAAKPVAENQRIVITPKAVDDAGFTVTREEDADGIRYRVRGERPQRWVRQTDFSNDEAVGYLADRLARLGVEDKLLELGATAGVDVVIGPEDNAVVFGWEPTIAAGTPLAGPRGSDDRLFQ